MKLSKVITLIVLLSTANLAQAALIYDNGIATADSGRCAETSGACNASWSVFDDFTIGSSSEVTSISWTARIYNGISDYNFSNIWIYDADPVFDAGSLLFSTSDAGTLSANGLGANFYDIEISGLSVNLAAGTYWLGMQHDTTAGYATVAMTGVFDNATQWSNGGSGSLNDDQPEFAFKINGEPRITTIPEPITFVLFSFAIMCLCFSKRNRKA